MTAYEIIAKKRDGKSLSPDEIRFFISEYLNGGVKDYQMAAWLMAVYFQGLNEEETFELTRAYIESGEVIDLSDIPGVKVDKHSTGGVGDKTSIVLAPLVASCGVTVPMISGRGLGHTGGTLDKLESIPGFNTQLSVAEFKQLLSRYGVAMIGQTETIVPADKRIYALRDVTATVESIPLITASIMSKKIAEGIDALVLDVKFGSGAFMPEVAKARALAQKLIEVGQAFGKRVHASLTNMDQPLGNKIGNWLEIEECLDVFRGKGPTDLVELTLQLSAHMLVLARRVKQLNEGIQLSREHLQNGSAYQKFLEMVAAQGGNPDILEHPERYPRAKHQHTVRAAASGFIQHMNTREIGLAAVRLGAGRMRKEDPVDPTAGIELLKKPGDRIREGDPIMILFTNNANVLTEVEGKILAAMRIGEKPPELPPLVLEEIGD